MAGEQTIVLEFLGAAVAATSVDQVLFVVGEKVAVAADKKWRHSRG